MQWLRCEHGVMLSDRTDAMREILFYVLLGIEQVVTKARSERSLLVERVLNPILFCRVAAVVKKRSGETALRIEVNRQNDRGAGFVGLLCLSNQSVGQSKSDSSFSNAPLAIDDANDLPGQLGPPCEFFQLFAMGWRQPAFQILRQLCHVG
jgi:hypothetical protein